MLLAIETVALSLACALATYCITFSLLEFYYVHLVVGSAGIDEAAHKANRPVERTSLSGVLQPSHPRPSSQAPPHHELLSFLQTSLTQFNPMRKTARDTMWWSMSSLLVAVVARIVQGAIERLGDPLTMTGAILASGAFVLAILSVHKTVRTFRAAYRPFLAERGHLW